MKSKDNAEIIDFIILYFQMRNVQKWGYVNYKNFKVLIIHITNIRDIDQLRHLFEKIMSMGFFEKRKIHSKTDYRFLFRGEDEVYAPTVLDHEEETIDGATTACV